MVPAGPAAVTSAAPAGAGRCTIWLADPAWLRPQHLLLLDEVERGRRERYRQAADRDRFALGAVLLRLLGARATGQDPAAVAVDRSCPRCEQPHGKPVLGGSDLHVSLSHSADLVAVAATRSGPVGVDVEALASRDVLGLAATVLSEQEHLEKPEDFYTFWCRKEAVVKATGDGLRTPLRQVVVGPAAEPGRLLSYCGAPLPGVLADLPVPAGYAGALAVLTDATVDLDVRDGTDLLSS